MTTDANGLVSLIKGTKQLKKTFNIFIKYCVPAKEKKVTTNVIQILTHGSTLNHTYWDFAPGYSYVDVAAASGLATLSYDRLGIGLSDHPNPLLETQGQAQIEIYHGLVQLVRSGALGHSFSKVIAVGHSYGSTLGDGTLSKYPNDFDALINTDYDGPLAWLKHTIFSLGLLKANTLPRLAHLPDGYLVPGKKEGLQTPFLKYPNFDPSVLDSTFETIQTFSLSELLNPANSTLWGNPVVLAAYTSPVMVVVGEHDFILCGRDCPQDKASQILQTTYSSADPRKSLSWLVPGSGHNINGHLNVDQVFHKMASWVNSLGWD
ncbi:hypothetical protein BHE90_000253 [Fusarium euwallaceae]|uniref:AB hydrolase-1 domain-containing protein n=1 Tax=Fusarium euwallaceae TaxID=1147111 RepID=A0A430MB00_9HYPO|nr:hypothetical protein BHE90_000253 [Fusarium euwallaceae]